MERACGRRRWNKADDDGELSRQRQGGVISSRETPHGEYAAALDLADLTPCLGDPALTSMTLLNEIGERFPDAISFAPGRPAPGSFTVDDVHAYLRHYCDHVARTGGPSQARDQMFQYGPTKGLIQEIIARNLATDENIDAVPDSIVVTVGAQEGLFLVLRALRASERDVVLAVSPTYAGFIGAARVAGMPVLAVRDSSDGIDIDDLVARLAHARATGLRPRACYVVPDFANPTGTRMPLRTRRRLLEVAAEEGILLVEDNAYGFFDLAGDGIPTLRSLDAAGVVVYVGSYAKTTVPGARIGFVVAAQRVNGAGILADHVSRLKSMVTVNTPAVAQAVLGGLLLTHGFHLRVASAEAVERCRVRLRRLLDGLEARFRPISAVRWNQPAGGFFVILTVPFPADDAALEYSARQHGVLWTPMHHFYVAEGGTRQLRLSCSMLRPDEIDAGLDRLASLIANPPRTEHAA